LFGAVPLVTNTLTIDESYKVTRSSVEEVYNQIEADLAIAVDYLPANHGTDNTGRATTWAARGYLGKVYLFMSGYPLVANRWEDARKRFKEVIDAGVFEFFTDYAAIYDHSNEGGK